MIVFLGCGVGVCEVVVFAGWCLYVLFIHLFDTGVCGVGVFLPGAWLCICLTAMFFEVND